ncbi:hypothetical protein AbraIFM66951_002413 [Aspergillus brasiliensis]|uniref:2-dehydropantoate 2-reductase n=1 Tax=Aspergillus brasiliensis TaxID=319629 RepID=A0A9W6DR10_9EURO|nr:hypothetical protein AbraCBS73388_001569 [Aspergillus brasiliensis]GKZ49709.1 hypothetical protein AbraIFM66951_002413 [Aspergillus brasiliensis]
MALRSSQTTRPTIHVLGLGSIGTFTAHGLKDIPNPPAVTLLLHRESLYQEYIRNNRRIALNTISGDTIHHSDYNLEIYKQGAWRTPTDSSADGQIHHLVVTVKATQTVSALRALRSRLSRASAILFLQNGCGMIDEVNEHLFPDPETRPNYLTGVISHGVTLASPFNAIHTGASAISLGLVPRENSQSSQNTPDAGNKLQEEGEPEYMLHNIPRSPRLSAKSYSFSDVFQIQLEKLAVNAFCNPVCALHDSKNGILFDFPELRRAILTEISNIVLRLPELRGVDGVEERFGVDRLEETVNGILERTRETTCSMVVDLRNRRETEIRFINGYWVRRGRQAGVSTAVNEELMDKVLRRSVVLRSE